MIKRLAKIIAENPLESVVFVFSLGLFAIAVYLLLPLYVVDVNAIPSILSAIPTNGGVIVFGLIMLGCSAPGIVAQFVPRWKKECLNYSTFLMFLMFFFLSLTRILVYGFTPLIWIYPLLLSLACGVMRLRLELKRG